MQFEAGGYASPPLSLHAIYTKFLTELTGCNSNGLCLDELKYRVREYLETTDNMVALLLILYDNNPDDAVQFYQDLETISKTCGNPAISVFVTVDGTVETALKALNPAIFDDPQQCTEIQRPTPHDYAGMIEAVMREVAVGHDLTAEARGGCAAYAAQKCGDETLVHKILRRAVDVLTSEHPDTTLITEHHIKTAYRQVLFDHLTPLKSPPENILFVQAYATRCLARPKTIKFEVPLQDLHDTYCMALETAAVSTIVPHYQLFEVAKDRLVEMGCFFIDNRNKTITIKPEWAYRENIEYILSWDYLEERDASWRETVTPPSNHTAAAAVIDKLYIGHLAALKAIIETYIDMGDQPPTLSQVYPRYVQICTERGLTPVAPNKSFRRIGHALEEKHLIKTHRRGRNTHVEPLQPRALSARVNLAIAHAINPRSVTMAPTIRQTRRPAPAQQLAMAAIQQTLEKTAKPHALLSDLYPQYVQTCTMEGVSPAGRSRFRGLLKELRDRGEISKRVVFVVGGQTQ
jgi:Cdc6-like AAA superfamily ATPase